MISVPEFGAPTETVLPLRSSIDSMPESALTTTWVMFGVDRPERAQRLLARERLVAAHRVDRGVAERERDVALAVGDQQQVVDRRRRGLGRRRRVGQLVGQDLGEAAAVDLVDAAGAAGGDRQPPLPAGRVVRRARGERDRHGDRADEPRSRTSGSSHAGLIPGSWTT